MRLAAEEARARQGGVFWRTFEEAADGELVLNSDA